MPQVSTAGTTSLRGSSQTQLNKPCRQPLSEIGTSQARNHCMSRQLRPRSRRLESRLSYHLHEKSATDCWAGNALLRLPSQKLNKMKDSSLRQGNPRKIGPAGGSMTRSTNPQIHGKYNQTKAYRTISSMSKSNPLKTIK